MKTSEILKTICKDKGIKYKDLGEEMGYDNCFYFYQKLGTERITVQNLIDALKILNCGLTINDKGKKYNIIGDDKDDKKVLNEKKEKIKVLNKMQGNEIAEDSEFYYIKIKKNK